MNSFDAPYVAIKDVVTVSGRITERKLAWQVFKETVAELEKKENTFKTIVVELVEDLYEHCRVYCYDKLHIEHESDNSFKAWDYVRNEFLNVMKRLMNLEYDNIVLESHEDSTKDITKKTGDKITTIKPNIGDKIALKLAGMVDVVCRIVVDGDNRKISFKTDEVIFGGGRLNIKDVEVPLGYETLMNVYGSNQKSSGNREVFTPKPEESSPKPEVEVSLTPDATSEPQAPVRSRRIR